MKLIKNIHLVEKELNEKDLEHLHQAAYQYARNAGVYFKFHYIKPDEVAIEVKQENPTAGSGEVFAVNKLVAIGKELTADIFPDRKVHIRPLAYVPPDVDVVTPEWIHKELSRLKLSGVKISRMTGVDRSSISNWISGNRTMSQPVKAMFYYMVKSMDK